METKRTIKVRAYAREWKTDWNTFLLLMAKNASFLLDRNFMDYHADRFTDASLLFYRDNERRPVAIFPAEVDREKRMVRSHGGLTYGGLIMAMDITCDEVRECFHLLFRHYREMGLVELLYKPMPYIYNVYPAQEDLYVLTQEGATLSARALSSVIDLTSHSPHAVRELRKRGARKGERAGLQVRTIEVDDEALDRFWDILNEVLTTHHNTTPVHTPEEMRLLMRRFPHAITLFGVFTPAGELVAGSWVFLVGGKVVHAQYIAASDEGRTLGALDFLFLHLIDLYREDYRYFDFGISTEHEGRLLNEGLLFQKEGFGARGVCYDTYKLALTDNGR
jgi:hypothetical protein